MSLRPRRPAKETRLRQLRMPRRSQSRHDPNLYWHLVGVSWTPVYALVAALLACSALPRASAAQGPPEYTREATVRPLRMTYGGLRAVLAKTVSIAQGPRAPADLKFVRMRTRIGDGEVKVALRTIDAWSIDSLPAMATSIDFAWSAEGADVSSVELHLEDGFRQVAVSGSSQEQVDALFAYLIGQLQDHTTIWGGLGFRFIASVLIVLALSIVGPLL